MSLIIDGHNLIGVLPDIDLADPDDELQLLDRLRAYRARAGGRPLIVFFDSGDMPGSLPDLSTPGLRVRFSKPGETADDAIVDFLRTRTQPGQYSVVTDDRALSERVRAIGASWIRSAEFAERLRRPTARTTTCPDESTPDPHAPAYADIYTGFLEAERNRARFASDPTVDAPAWIERLYGDDIHEAQRAARWLGQFGGAQALEPLRDALTHGDVRVRAAALLALGNLGDPAALPDLCQRLSDDPASMAREAAAQALARIGDASVLPALEIAASNDPKRKVRKAARAALAQVRARTSSYSDSEKT